MKTEIKLLNKLELKKAINFLKQNKIIILPTDTIYGLSAVYSEENEKKINRIKKSSSNKKLIILVSNFKQIKTFGIKLNKSLKQILKSNKPTTILFTIDEKNNKKIAIRMPNRKDIKTILNKVGPVFSTSVNISNEAYANTHEELKKFGKHVEEVFYIGELNSKPSRIIDQSLKIIRE